MTQISENVVNCNKLNLNLLLNEQDICRYFSYIYVLGGSVVIYV